MKMDRISSAFNSDVASSCAKMKWLLASLLFYTSIPAIAAPSLNVNGFCADTVMESFIGGLYSLARESCGTGYSITSTDAIANSASRNQIGTYQSENYGGRVEVDVTSFSSSRASYGNIGAGAAASIARMKTYDGMFAVISAEGSAQAQFFDTFTVNSNSLSSGNEVRFRVQSETFYSVWDHAIASNGVSFSDINTNSGIYSLITIESLTPGGANLRQFACGGRSTIEPCAPINGNTVGRVFFDEEIIGHVGESFKISASIVSVAELTGRAENNSGRPFVDGSFDRAVEAMNSQHLTLDFSGTSASYSTESGTIYNYASSVPEPSTLSLVIFPALVFVFGMRLKGLTVGSTRTKMLRIFAG